MGDLTTIDGARAYLQNTPYAALDVELLSGGHSAFTYRITLQAPLLTGEKTLVLKHYERYFSDYELKRDAERGHRSNPETHTVFMTDLGPTVILGRALTGLLGIGAEIGAALGDFMGRFHDWGAASEQAELRDVCSHNAVVKSASYFGDRFEIMMQSVERFGLGKKWIEELVTKWREAGFARGDGEVLAMGDFWLDNVLISMPDSNHGLRVYIIDWEMALPTYAEFDMGEFIGTAMRLGRELYPQGDDQFVSAVPYVTGKRNGFGMVAPVVVEI